MLLTTATTGTTIAATAARDVLAALAPTRALEILRPGTLRTPRMVIRPLRENDRAAFIAAAGASREEVAPWVDLWPKPGDDHAAFDRQLELLARAEASGRGWRRAAFLDDGRMVGCFNLSDITSGLERRGQASWWVATPLTGRGLGSEGVAAMLTHALAGGGLDLLEVYATVHEDNSAGARLCVNAGMTPAASCVATVLLGGRWHPHRVFVKRATL